MKHELSQKVKLSLKNWEHRKNREGYSILSNPLCGVLTPTLGKDIRKEGHQG